MALSLAACGGSSSTTTTTTTDTTTTDTDTTTVVHPDAIALTTSEDTFVGTALNDTFTATSATLSANDNIVDTSSTDSDVLNITLTAAAPTIDVSGIESINVAWDSLLTPTMDIDDIDGATVTFSGTLYVEKFGEVIGDGLYCLEIYLDDFIQLF